MRRGEKNRQTLNSERLIVHIRIHMYVYTRNTAREPVHANDIHI